MGKRKNFKIKVLTPGFSDIDVADLIPLLNNWWPYVLGHDFMANEFSGKYINGWSTYSLEDLTKEINKIFADHLDREIEVEVTMDNQ